MVSSIIGPTLTLQGLHISLSPSSAHTPYAPRSAIFDTKNLDSNLSWLNNSRRLATESLYPSCIASSASPKWATRYVRPQPSDSKEETRILISSANKKRKEDTSKEEAQAANNTESLGRMGKMYYAGPSRL
ncbi:MAG: hypothetical protein M1824_000477 [Vezdaea acicularis]|nr:MAG: hypothetical protein M1824_000477 [Vezdaea acicularis]